MKRHENIFCSQPKNNSIVTNLTEYERVYTCLKKIQQMEP